MSYLHYNMALLMFKCCGPQRQRSWATWSRQLSQFGVCGHPTPADVVCSKKRTRSELSRRTFTVVAPPTCGTLGVAAWCSGSVVGL